jgi:lysyl-tRNA synthetase class 1
MTMFGYIDTWLEKWATDDVKFEVQETLPDVELSAEQKAMLGDLSQSIKSQSDQQSAEWFHAAVHEAREAHGLTPKEGFVAMYRVLLGKDFGPRGGWFLASFERDWLLKRFTEASEK